jgi:amino acid adenylation domain-containing protein
MCIAEVVRQVCHRHQGKIAVSSPLGNITYAQLLRRVNGLAYTLRQHSIGPGSRVGIHLDRSIDMIVAIFGTLAAGATYVPLDPEYPVARLRQIIHDSQVSLLLSTTGHLAKEGVPASLSPDDWDPEGPEFIPTDSGPAYIAYTSGSTGTPKGVVIGHGSLKNYLAWTLSELPFTGGGVPLFASISFDHSVTCYFAPLLKGEPLILLPSLQGGRALASGLLTGCHYSFVKITPSHLRLLDYDQRAQLGRSTDLILFGGERLTVDLVSDVRRDNPTLAVINHYGPTEATVGCCYYRVPLNPPAQATIPIGKPMPGVEARVRIENGLLTESAGTGELLIGGKALAEGYWGQPDLTARSFVTIADDEGHPSRWYCTGDLVTRSDDGNMAFIGRKDHQIKIMGHRIEPAEIEAALRSDPNVREVAVIAEERHGSLAIIAAVILCHDSYGESQIRSRLRSILPSAMVPSRILVLDSLPITATGKLDRESILSGAYEEQPYAVARTSTEESIAIKFSEALGIPNILPDDDFFDLGGDSMAAVEIITWASEYFQVPLETAALFEHATIRTLAAHISSLGCN